MVWQVSKLCIFGFAIIGDGSAHSLSSGLEVKMLVRVWHLWADTALETRGPLEAPLRRRVASISRMHKPEDIRPSPPPGRRRVPTRRCTVFLGSLVMIAKSEGKQIPSDIACCFAGRNSTSFTHGDIGNLVVWLRESFESPSRWRSHAIWSSWLVSLNVTSTVMHIALLVAQFRWGSEGGVRGEGLGATLS